MNEAKMVRIPVFLALIALFSGSEAWKPGPITDEHRTAALQLFKHVDGWSQSLEETYQAMRIFKVLGNEKFAELRPAACSRALTTLQSPPSDPKRIYDALALNNILRCEVGFNTYKSIAAKLLAALKEASSVHEFYYSVYSLVLVKYDGSTDVFLADADAIFQAIMALRQSDGRWRHSSSSSESSTYATGLALEALASVVDLGGSKIHPYMVGVVNKYITNLYDRLEEDDNGGLYLDDKLVDGPEHQGQLSTTWSVLCGILSFAQVTGGHIPGDIAPGFTHFFFGIGVPGNVKDLFYQLDALAYLQENSATTPMFLSVHTPVLSLSNKDHLKVSLATLLGSKAPLSKMKLVQVVSANNESPPTIVNQELKFDPDNSVHHLDILSRMNIDVGKYILLFSVSSYDPRNILYAPGAETYAEIHVTR